MKKLFPFFFLILILACQNHPGETAISKNDTINKKDTIAKLPVSMPVSADTSIHSNEDTIRILRTTPFGIEVELKMPGEDSTGGLILITKDGKAFKTIHSEGKRYHVDMDLNAYYLFKCSKKGFTTKVIYFDANVPKGREKEEFARFIATVELYKEVKGKNTNTDIPVGGVKYNKVAEDFDKVNE